MIMTPNRLASIPASYGEKRRQYLIHLLEIKKAEPHPEETYLLNDENGNHLVFGEHRILWKKA